MSGKNERKKCYQFEEKKRQDQHMNNVMNITTEINQRNEHKHIKAHVSEAFIFPMW